MAIDRASDPVVRFAIFDRQQPHDHIRPQRNTHLWPTPRHHDRLTNPEAMSRHGGYLGWHRTENNGPPTPRSSPLVRPREAAGWPPEKTGGVANLWRPAISKRLPKSHSGSWN
jgi:hypothetical protein